MLTSENSMAITLVNSQLKWLLTQDVHRVKPPKMVAQKEDPSWVPNLSEELFLGSSCWEKQDVPFEVFSYSQFAHVFVHVPTPVHVWTVQVGPSSFHKEKIIKIINCKYPPSKGSWKVDISVNTWKIGGGGNYVRSV